ncbi:MAG: GntR family transcriptional regulator [Lautropia sp.]
MESPDPIRQLQGRTLATLVAERLERRVVDGTLAGGERLNEVALAAELGVSRGPVRESIRILERKGLVRVVANRGAFVCSVDVDDMLDLYRIRAAMTGLACELAAQRADDAMLDALRAQVRQMDAATDAGDLAGYYALNLAFHARLVECSGSARLRGFNDQLVAQAHLFRRGSLARIGDMQRSNAEHRGIVEAIGARDAAAARERGAAHVDAGRERFVGAIGISR